MAERGREPYPTRRLATENGRHGWMSSADKVRLDAQATITSVASPLTLAAGVLDIQAATASLEGSMSAAQAALVAQLATDTGWTALSYATNWGDFGVGVTAGVQKLDALGRLCLQGVVKKGVALSLPDTIATLPSGRRPTREKIYIVAASGGVTGEIRVQADGDIVLNAGGSGTYLSLDSIPPIDLTT